jgi:hypothetical protein
MNAYLVWCPDLGGTSMDALHIDAGAPDLAAEEWAYRYDRDSAEYSIVGGQPATVHVLDMATGRETRWSVVGEAVPSYTATEAEDDDE